MRSLPRTEGLANISEYYRLQHNAASRYDSSSTFPVLLEHAFDEKNIHRGSLSDDLCRPRGLHDR